MRASWSQSVFSSEGVWPFHVRILLVELPFQMWDTDSTQTHAWKTMGIHTREKSKLKKKKSPVIYFFLLTSHSAWNLGLHLQTETSGISAVEMFGLRKRNVTLSYGFSTAKNIFSDSCNYRRLLSSCYLTTWRAKYKGVEYSWSQLEWGAPRRIYRWHVLWCLG